MKHVIIWYAFKGKKEQVKYNIKHPFMWYVFKETKEQVKCKIQNMLIMWYGFEEKKEQVKCKICKTCYHVVTSQPAAATQLWPSKG